MSVLASLFIFVRNLMGFPGTMAKVRVSAVVLLAFVLTTSQFHSVSTFLGSNRSLASDKENASTKKNTSTPTLPGQSTNAAGNSKLVSKTVVASKRVALINEAIKSRLSDSVRYLASDELEGRGIGTDGLEEAAQFIAQRFGDLGLKTDAVNGGPFQEFSYRTRFSLGTANSLVLTQSDGSQVNAKVGQDFRPLTWSGNKQFDLPVVFVGYGITDKSIGYDDYDGTNVKGKAVILLRHEPQQAIEKSPFKKTERITVNGKSYSRHSLISTKINNAIAHGAALVIICTDSYQLKKSSSDGAKSKSDPLLRSMIKHSELNHQYKATVVHCKRVLVDQLIEKSIGKTLDQLEAGIDKNLVPASQKLPGCRIGGTVSVIREGRSLKNVIGILEGTGQFAEETIVVGAHYDHLGTGGWGSLEFGADGEIHNGADDNASGTAMLIEIATQLTARKVKLPRRVVFIAFSAEEQGLLGSKRYVRDPIIPLKDTVAMVNLDMVGRLRNNKLIVFGTGTATEFDSMIDRLSKRHGFLVSKHTTGYGPSDHQSFYSRGIPVLHFFTGLHAQYHRPADDIEWLNFSGMRRITEMVVDSVVDIASAKDKPQPMKSQSSSSLVSAGPLTSVNKKNSRAFLGVTAVRKPGDQQGFLISAIAKGSPAAGSGIRVGDRITSVNGKPLKTSADLVNELRKFRPGNKAKFILKRGKDELEFEIVLGTRSR